MATDPPAPSADTGALLLCRTAPDRLAPVAELLGERMLLLPAGDGWSVLVPEGKPWREADETVDRVLPGWASALAVGADWPVLALWWDSGQSGCSLASGFRRSVGYVWLANGTPVGEDEAMHTLAVRLRLEGGDPAGPPASGDPGAASSPATDGDRVLSRLTALTRSAPGTDSRSRLVELIEILGRAGIELPAGLTPGSRADQLREAARVHPHVRTVEPGRGARMRRALQQLPQAAAQAGSGRLPELPPHTRALAQLGLGLPLLLWGLGRRRAGWALAGCLLLGYGACDWARAEGEGEAGADTPA